MGSENQSASGSKGMWWAGVVMSALPVLMMVGGGVYSVMDPEAAKEGFVVYGYPEDFFFILTGVEMFCVLAYVIPQTSVLGAILLTGYLGGATATHVRASEASFFMPVLVGVFVWGGLFLRDPRIRALIPFRK